ncbi:MAG: DUF3810 family protein [Acidobacteriota bacterium]|nr:DUF3810 family protein [Acidobacteriota bacterium]
MRPYYDRGDRHRRLPGWCRWGLGAAGVTLVTFVLLARLPGLVEAVYARRVYPLVARVLAGSSAWLPFSLAEFSFLLVGLAVLGALVFGYRGARRRGAGGITAAFSGLVRVLAVGGWAWSLFVALWGLNYLRDPPVAIFRLGPPPAAEVAGRWRERIGERLDLLRDGLEEDSRGVIRTPEDLPALDRRIRELEAAAAADLGLPRPAGGRTKVFLSSPLLLRWGVSGTYGPFTGEPNVVLPAPPGLLPAIMAHERAHLAGMAWEEAASFLGLLTLWRSDDPRLRYSAWLSLWLELNPTTSGRSPAVRRDLRAIAAFSRAHRGWEAPAVRRTYSAYLEAHGVTGGTASYSRVADLALRYLNSSGMPRALEP